MTNAEKEQVFATARALDRIAIPLLLAGAGVTEAYRTALKSLEPAAMAR